VKQDCVGLFCFIGAAPETAWLSGIAADDHGFLLTDAQLADDDVGGAWAEIRRRPLPFETSRPGVFAAGDVRSGSMKRVAAAVGEGASAVSSVHAALRAAAALSSARG
jgi:thioredoxin reductase (NADPH)